MAPVAALRGLRERIANILQDHSQAGAHQPSISRSPYNVWNPPIAGGPAPESTAAAERRDELSPKQHPTRTLETLFDSPSTLLHPRQNGATTSTVPGLYPLLGVSPDPATTVGITLGSVGGFLLLLWLLYTCMQVNNNEVLSTGTASETESVRERERRRRRQSSRRSEGATAARGSRRRSSRRETVEVRTRDEPGGVEEINIRRSTSRAPPMPPPPPPMSAPRVVEESDSDDDDEVVVIEENSPPRRHKSNKGERRRGSSSVRRESYREVDIERDRFRGEDVPLREVRRSSRRDSRDRR